MEYDPRIKLNVFEKPTTYATDFSKFVPDKREKYTWPRDRAERPQKQPREYEPEDHETFQKWQKNVYIPFDLLIKPKPIIDTCPKCTFSKIEKPIDKGKEHAIKTRPRLYTSPAVSMDDVPDPEVRKMLCDYMYTTEWNKAVKEAAQGVTDFPTQNTTWELGGDPVALYTDLSPALPAGWRQHGKAWDNNQRRAFVDPTESFWVNKDPPMKCGACVNPFKGAVEKERKEEIADLIKLDKLRLAHDRPIPGYAGYRPRMSTGVPLSKVELPVTHPFLSASQAITQRYADDKREGGQKK